MGGDGYSGPDSLHMPDSRPTAKQLESLLKETDKTVVGLDDSMGGRTFMAASWVSWMGHATGLEEMPSREEDVGRSNRRSRARLSAIASWGRA